MDFVSIKDSISLGESKSYFKISDNKIKYHNGKSYKYSDPEEEIRAYFIVALIEKYKYPIENIDTEVLPPTRATKNPSDIVVYRDKRKNDVFLVIECKASSSKADVETAKRQMLGNANLLKSRYMVVGAGTEIFAYDASNPVNIRNIEQARIADIPVKYGKEPKYRFSKNPSSNLSKISFRDLNNRFSACHVDIWENGKRDPAITFDEMSKLVSAKIFDETYTKNGDNYKFQIGTHETQKIVADRIHDLYEDVKLKRNIFFDNIDLPDDIVASVVSHLQDVSLSRTDLDVKGRAFENILGNLFRGEYGQFFTPREVVSFAIDMVEPTDNDIIIDPACGSGGFLIYAMNHVLSKMRRDYSGEDYEKNSNSFANNNLFGIEINERLTRVAMTDMIIHEDGHSNIENSDALQDYNLFAEEKNIEANKYSLILTNPPFSHKNKIDKKKEYFPNYELSYDSNGKLKKSAAPQILFIERCIDLLKVGGRMSIVLPDSAFTNKENMGVLRFILENAYVDAVVSLPNSAFAPYGAESTKTSLLFLRKKEKSAQIEKYNIFMAHVERIGYDSTLRPDENDLPRVYLEYQRFKKGGYPCFNNINENLWISKVSSRTLTDKLDVEAYSEEYIKLMAKLNDEKCAALKELVLDKGVFSGVGFASKDYDSSGICVVKTGCVEKIGKFGAIDWKKISFVNGSKKISKQKKIALNDILLQSVAHNKKYIADKIAILDKIPERYKDIVALSKFIVIRPDVKKVAPSYLYAVLCSDIGRIQIKHFIRGMSGEVYPFDIENILIPNLTISKQRKIGRHYKKLLERYLEQSNSLKEILSQLEAFEL